jgi:hypothetical protein
MTFVATLLLIVGFVACSFLALATGYLMGVNAERVRWLAKQEQESSHAE